MFIIGLDLDVGFDSWLLGIVHSTVCCLLVCLAFCYRSCEGLSIRSVQHVEYIMWIDI